MSDAVTKAYEKRCRKAEATIAILRNAVGFYANRNHWMGLSEQSEQQMLLIAHGNNDAFTASASGWGMAEWALRQASVLDLEPESHSADWLAGFMAAREQAANLMGHFIVDEGGEVSLAEKCYNEVAAMAPAARNAQPQTPQCDR